MADDGLVDRNPEGWPVPRGRAAQAPPADHLLDHLVRQRILYADDRHLSLPDYYAHMDGPGTVAVISELPECDICLRRERVSKPARYDAKIVADTRGIWAYMCVDCFLEQSSQELGTGIGQFLMREEEIPAEVEKRLENAKAIWEPRLAEVGGDPP